MLNPDKIHSLRNAITSRGSVTEFDGFSIRSLPVKLATAEELPMVVISDVQEVNMRSPDRIFGAPFDPSCLNGTEDGARSIPKVLFYRIRGGMVIGNNAVLSGDGQLYAPDPLTNVNLDLAARKNATNHQGFVLTSSTEGVHAHFMARPSPIKYQGTALFLHNLEPSNYGSFVFRQLPQMMLAAALNLDIDYIIVPERTPWVMEALQHFHMDRIPVFTGREVSGDRFEELVVANEFDAEGLLTPGVAKHFEGLVEDRLPRPFPFRSRKLYVSRRLSALSRPAYRNLLNEEEIEGHFRRIGFDVVFPETLSFIHQVMLFRDARAVAGTSGSGMLNAAFTSPGAKILDLESFHYTVRQHAKIYASTGKCYAFAFGQLEPDEAVPPHIRNWRMPSKVILEASEWILS